MAKAKKQRKVKGYMCGIDWQHELGEAMGGNTVYASAKDLKRHHTAWEECGIVEVEITLSKWVEPQDLFRNVNKKEKTDEKV